MANVAELDNGSGYLVQRLTFLLLIPALVYPYPQRVQDILSRDKRDGACPIPDDPEWRHGNNQCQKNQTYHCLDNGSLIVQGCYQPLECSAGARPVIEVSGVMCRECPPGTYQPKDQLRTDRTTASYCIDHTPCNLVYGKKECRAGTTSTDIGCTCDPDRGYSQIHPNRKDCGCFTKNDFCGCDLTGCVNGSTQNAQGLCVPITTVSKSLEKTTLVLTSTTLPAEAAEKVDVTLVVTMVIAVVMLIGIVIAAIVWRKKIQRVLQKCKSEVNGKSKNTGNGHTYGKVSTSADGTENIQRSSVYKLENCNISQLIIQGPTIPHVKVKKTLQTVNQTGKNTVIYQNNTIPQVSDEHTSPSFSQDHPTSTTTPSTILMSSSAVPDESVTSTPGDDTTTTTLLSAPDTLKSTQSRSEPVAKDSFTQIGENNTVTVTYIRGTGSKSEYRPSDEDEEHLNVQSSRAVPQVVQSSGFVAQSEEPRSTPTPTIIAPSGARVTHDSGDNASSFNLTPGQRPSQSAQKPQSDPSAPPDETPYPEPSAPPQSMHCFDAADGGEEECNPLYSSEETEVKSVL